MMFSKGKDKGKGKGNNDNIEGKGNDIVYRVNGKGKGNNIVFDEGEGNNIVFDSTRGNKIRSHDILQSPSPMTRRKEDARRQTEITEHVSIEIAQLNKGLADSIKGKLVGSNPSLSGSSNPSLSNSQCSIYRVNEKFRKINEYAYTPDMISIGPFHRGKGNLPAMENHKLCYVHALFSRTNTIGSKLEKCVESIRKIEEEARRCYSEPIEMNSNDFVEMMLVDGLFIIELFRKSAGKVKSEKDDPIFNNIWGLSSFVRDLILLENQIPMIVLNRLFNLHALKEELQGSPSFTMLALRFFNPLMPRDKEVLKNHVNCQGKHLLDLLGKTFHNVSHREKLKNNSWKFVPSVTELKHAGVKFKKGSEKGNFLEIKFSNGVLEIPLIFVQDQTDSLLRNLIASEQYCDEHVTYITSYAFFMGSLINSADDVMLLRNKGIITNYLGDDEDVYLLFKKLCCEVTLDNFYYAELCNQVNKHYEKRWHKWRATLKNNYFNNPWVIISVIAASFLLVLTLTSTIFASLSYIVHKS